MESTRKMTRPEGYPMPAMPVRGVAGRENYFIKVSRDFCRCSIENW